MCWANRPAGWASRRIEWATSRMAFTFFFGIRSSMFGILMMVSDSSRSGCSQWEALVEFPDRSMQICWSSNRTESHTRKPNAIQQQSIVWLNTPPIVPVRCMIVHDQWSCTRWIMHHIKCSEHQKWSDSRCTPVYRAAFSAPNLENQPFNEFAARGKWAHLLDHKGTDSIRPMNKARFPAHLTSSLLRLKFFESSNSSWVILAWSGSSVSISFLLQKMRFSSIFWFLIHFLI